MAFPFDAGTFRALRELLSGVAYRGSAPPAPAWGTGDSANPPWVVWTADHAAAWMPPAYRAAYLSPLRNAAAGTFDACIPDDQESLCGPMVQLDPAADTALDALALVGACADPWRKVVASAGTAPPSPAPLAAFKHWDLVGPWTLIPEAYRRYVPGTAPIVLFPAVYRVEPLLLALCAHEAGGHAAFQAIPSLRDDLRNAVAREFPASPPSPYRPLDDGQLSAGIWPHWSEEIAADLVATRLAGPAYALTLLAWLAAVNRRGSGWTTDFSPVCDVRAGGSMDAHPPEIVRVAIVAAAIETLSGLSSDARKASSDAALALVPADARKALRVSLFGDVTVGGVRCTVARRDLGVERLWGEAGRAVSALATARLPSLGDRALADVCGWTDADVALAESAGAALASGGRAPREAGGGHVLAGAVAAATASPSLAPAIRAGTRSAFAVLAARDPDWREYPFPSGVRADA